MSPLSSFTVGNAPYPPSNSSKPSFEGAFWVVVARRAVKALDRGVSDDGASGVSYPAACPIGSADAAVSVWLVSG
jgi:hypothetical protein